MQFRVARHTHDLQRMIGFYQGVLGMELLGSFNNHDGYDGIFLGWKNSGWHLEFTVSEEAPQHTPDDDDLLVFYFDTTDACEQMKARFRQQNIPGIPPKNPYWKTNGATYSDPDGYRVVLSVYNPS